MNMHVLFQIALKTETSATDATLKRLFFGMCSFVAFVRIATYEEFLAIQTLPFSFLPSGYGYLESKKMYN